MSHLTEQHRDKLGPARESLGSPFGAVLFDQDLELVPGKVLKKLTEQTPGP
jgi:hypothetical protein